MNFYIKTYGCQMNERESESAAALLTEAGFHQVDSEFEADIVILNTCSVRDQAERKAIGKLGFLKKRLAEHPNMVFGIMGCMAQSRGEELLIQIPHLDFAVGTDQVHRIPEFVKKAIEGKNSGLSRAAERQVGSFGSRVGKRKLSDFDRADADTPGVDAHRMPHEGDDPEISAFISIMRGCNRYCSYCIVPFVRGPERSRDPEGIVREAQMLADRGVKEIMLLGQNVAAYGLNGAAKPSSDGESPFADLLTRLNDIPNLKRIRFTSPHPAFFNERLIEAIAKLDKVCKSVHLPLQSGSDRILKAMNRPYDSAHFMSIVKRLRELSPEITFSTDVIVGFPGETEEDFNMTRALMNEVSFDNSYIFKYSPRKGTRSSRLEDDVPQEEKERRNQILLADLDERLCIKNAALVGHVFEVMAEGPSKRNSTRWSGRTDHFKTVVFEPSENIKPGDFLNVKITRSTSMTLYGEVC